MELNIKENTAQKAVIALCGDLDTAASQQFATEMEPFIADAGKEIIVDFNALEYISSAGMRTILQLNKNAIIKGGKVTITGMSEDIRQLFQMTGFDKMLTIL